MKVWYYTLMPWPYAYGTIPYPFPAAHFDRALAPGLYQGYLELFRHAEDLGYDGIALAEHHSTKIGTAPSPNLIAAAVAAQTSRVTIAILGDCLPLHGHPLRLAEELAMIDVLSNGRLVAGFIRGGGREYQAYGVDIAQGRSMFEEAWDLIVKAWTEPEPFAWHGTHYHYDSVSILPRPIQQPHPPVVAAATTAESIEFAARHHAPLFMGFAPEQQIIEGFAYYRRFAETECGWSPTSDDMGIIGPVYVSNSDASARSEAEAHMLVHYEELASLTQGALRAFTARRESERSYAYRSPATTAHEAPPRADYETLSRQRYYVGSPDTVTRRLLEKKEKLGIGLFAGVTPFGSMEPAQARQSMELFAREVLPNLR